MHVRLLLFAAYREIVGERQLELEVPDRTTVGDVYRIMEGKLPALAPLRPYTTFAVNREVVEAFTPLQAGDEVAFLQPASGG